MAAVDLATKDDLAGVLAELRALRSELAQLANARRAEPVSMEEAARHLGVSTRTIRRWAKSGEVPTVRVGRTVRVRLDAVDPPR